ncbi:hypothetical protein [Adhaeretor mobilis]|uniref:PEP-CTERM protein-sorting domain-containing protein n=1 Tax=Adhaeretor mobilis TaxID=1930276 RepID=A0A517MZD6_9BACT|nr:hypothetical protein [Adhaeretor mobilis]QDT00250.1 hypothetical protein HG15A2_35860 [Adhaeretor mobilis]
MTRLIASSLFVGLFSVLATTVGLKSATADIVIDGSPPASAPGTVPFGLAGGSGLDVLDNYIISYTGINLAATENLYFGIANHSVKTGYSMDGGGITGDEIFRFVSASGNSLVYSGETTIKFDGSNPPADYASPTRFTLTFTGTGSFVEDGTTTGLSNPNGDVGALWHVQGDFSVSLLMEATAPPGDTNAGNFEPGRDLFNRLGTLSTTETDSSIDFGFYYESVAVPEASSFLCLGLVALAAGGWQQMRRIPLPR